MDCRPLRSPSHLRVGRLLLSLWPIGPLLWYLGMWVPLLLSWIDILWRRRHDDSPDTIPGSIARFRDTPVIAGTGGTNILDEREAFAVRFVDVSSRPFLDFDVAVGAEETHPW